MLFHAQVGTVASALHTPWRRKGFFCKFLARASGGRHDHYDLAARWFIAHAAQGWARCPLTQNGALRIMCAPAYPGTRPVVQVLSQMQVLCARAHHRFWPDALSLMQTGLLNCRHLLGRRQLTDPYLLALAVHHQGRLVTLDGGVALQSVNGAEPAHLLRLLP